MEGTEVRKLAALEDRHWWYAERRRIVRGLIDEERKQGQRPGVALDVGAAGGGNTRVLRAAGYLAVPIEYGPDGADVARSRGLPSVRGDARRLPFRDGAAQVVLAFDLLEHIVEDADVVREFARVLDVDGVLWIAVPADMALWSAHDEAVGHVRRYSRESLELLLSQGGFRLDEVRSWNVLLRPVVALRRRRSRGSDLEDIGAATNWCLGRVIALERYLPVLWRRRGVTLLVRARPLNGIRKSSDDLPSR